MTGASIDASARWQDAVLAAALFAVDPVGTGGVCLTALPGPARDAWSTLARELWPPAAPWRRVPLHVGDDRLLGGLDLAATLAAGRPVCERGILADADGGVIVLAMAERIAPGTAARIHAVVDAGAVAIERDGVAARWATRFGIIAMDESAGADEAPPAGLVDRLAFHVDLDAIAMRDLIADVPAPDAILAARAQLPTVTVDAAMLEALVAAASALGIASLRAPLLALRVARAAAALAGRDAIDRDDAALAARLVLAPRATRLPIAEPPPDEDSVPPGDEADDASPAPADDAPAPAPDDETAGDERGGPDTGQPLDDVVLAAAQAAIPAGLIALLAHGPRRRIAANTAGRSGAQQKQSRRGHVIGALRGDPRQGARLAVIATLRAAAPWQAIRRKAAGAANAASALAAPPTTRRHPAAGPSPSPTAPRIEVRREDFHVVRRMQRRQTTTIFAVDASGSTALHRLAEAKGAVELLLADCYVRRDHVALLAFRGRVAELLLPPTRSLVRAKRCLAALPGGGGTPLASGIDAAMRLAETVLRRGETPVVVFLTDGRANIARDGTGGRARAEEEALAAARLAGAAQLMILVVDTSPQPHPLARTLADAMGARYLPLPYAGAAVMSAAVRHATEAPALRP